MQDVVELELNTTASGGPPTPANAYTINGQPGPNYNCSNNGNKVKFKIMLMLKMYNIYRVSQRLVSNVIDKHVPNNETIVHSFISSICFSYYITYII